MKYSIITITLLTFMVFFTPYRLDAQDTLRVRVMTYNLRFGELASLEDLAAHIKSFKPDFVALEEVDCHTQRERAPHQNGKDFISELAFRTGMLGLYGKCFDYHEGYYGVGILSKYPYSEVKKILLPRPKPKHEQRVLLEGVFEISDKDTLVFAATHLDVKLNSTREVQGQFITDYYKNCKYPVIVGGDFNARPYHRIITEIMNKNWFSATNDELSFPAWNPIIKIDYLYARPKNDWHLIRTQTVHSQLSDHLPIVTELEYIK